MKVFGVLLLVSIFVGGFVFGEDRERPNVILVMTDDQGFGQMGAHGHPWLKTPAMDEMRAKGVRFTQFMVSPTCAPTRAALMSGRYPFAVGVTHTIIERERLALGVKILPEMLKKAGYVSGIFGKWHLGDEDAYQPGVRGFDEVFIHGAGGIGQAYPGACADVPKNTYQDPVVRHNGHFVKTKGFCTDVFFEAAEGWMDKVRKEKKPFFAYIATNAPHGPFLAPASAKKRFLDAGFKGEQAGFYGMIENIDANLGRMMKWLEAEKMLANTVVIFMSDNGTTGAGVGRAKVLGKDLDGKAMRVYNAGMKGWKGSVNEGGVKVPFFVRWDGIFEGGRDIDALSAHVDLVPTLMALVGVGGLPEGLPGRSLLGLMKGDEVSSEERFVFSAVGRWKQGSDPDASKWKGFSVRSQRYRLVGREALFDMEKDPGQQLNVIKEHAEVAAKMMAAYGAFWDGVRPLMVNEDHALSETKPFWEAYRKQESEGGIPAWGE